ncbi:hypothetical protein WDW37_00530 [Bdellovibrionota bacterium FG-1]
MISFASLFVMSLAHAGNEDGKVRKMEQLDADTFSQDQGERLPTTRTGELKYKIIVAAQPNTWIWTSDQVSKERHALALKATEDECRLTFSGRVVGEPLFENTNYGLRCFSICMYETTAQ